MIWFKNAIIYEITKDLYWGDLQSQLDTQRYHPCGSYDQNKFGWSEPLRDSELLHHSAEGFILIVAQREEKILPPHVIKKHLDERIAKYEEETDRKLSKVEKQQIKDDVINELLPRAFSRYTQTALLIDTNKNHIYVDASSTKRAEDVLALLRKSLGSLPVVPLAFANDPSAVMTDWIANDNLPAWLVALEEAELTSTTDEAVIRCKQQLLDSDEMQQHFTAHKQVTKLALEWEEHLSFVLQQDCSLKRLKFAGSVREKNDDILMEDFAQRFDADFVLMAGELSEVVQRLIDNFKSDED